MERWCFATGVISRLVERRSTERSKGFNHRGHRGAQGTAEFLIGHEITD